MFFSIISIIFILLIGINISKSIKDGIELLIFWLLYVISILSIISVFLTGLFFIRLKDKKGPRGLRGLPGDKGKKGKTGVCEPGCRNSICTNNVLKEITNHLNILADRPDPPIEVKNIYIKEKIKQICNSNEYANGAGMKGPKALNDYISHTWKEWVTLIYNEGGRAYFESVGAENEWEWVNNNPFNEIKKYDLFYWGLGLHYRPQIKNRCIRNSDLESKSTKINNNQSGYPEVEDDDIFTGEGWRYYTKKPTKYSVLNYLYLLPEGFLTHKISQKRMKAITADENKSNSYTIRKFNPSTTNYDVCLSVNGNVVEEKLCNPSELSQHWEIEFVGRQKDCRIKKNGKYLKQMPITRNSRSFVDSLTTDIPSDSNTDYTLFTFQND